MALAAAILALLGVLTGLYGTFLMTVGYHPFETRTMAGVARNFFRVLWMFLSFRWEKASATIRDVAFYGELNPEDRPLSLRGIYVLGVSFLLQTISALIAIADVCLKAHAKS